MDPMTIAIFAGAGLKAYGQYQAGQAQARAAKLQAKMKQAQASEMLDRMVIQEDRMNKQGQAYKADQLNDYSSHGVEIGTGSTLLALEDTNMKISQGIDDMRRDTIFRANQIIQGASYESQQGRDATTAGAISAGGSLLEGVGSYYKNVK